MAVGDFETIQFQEEPDRQPGFLIKAHQVELLPPKPVDEEAGVVHETADDEDAA